MRFNIAALLLAAVAGTALAAPSPIGPIGPIGPVHPPLAGSTLRKIAKIVTGLEKGTGLAKTERQLVGVVGDLSKLERHLGKPLAKVLKDLKNTGLDDNALSAVLTVLALIDGGTPAAVANLLLSTLTGGVLTDIGDVIGLPTATIVVDLAGSV